MRSKLKQYSLTRNTNVVWLGQIPVHWKVRRLKNVAHIIMGQSPQSEKCNFNLVGLPFLQGCAEFGVENPKPIQFCQSPPVTCPSGAILLSVRAPVGRLNTADQVYGVGRGLCAIVPNSRKLSSKFTRYLFEVTREGLQYVSTGSTYDAVTVGNVENQLLILPPFSEQTVIVYFLDYMDKRIQKYVQRRKKLIELFKEQKKFIIHSAVTRGLNPTVQLKESEIQWLGEIPAHWATSFLRNHYNIQSGKTLQSKKINKQDQIVNYITVRHVQWHSIQKTNLPKMWATSDEIQKLLIQPGDLLVCEGGEGGRCNVVDFKLKQETIIQNHIHRIRPSKHCTNSFLQYIMTTMSNFGWFDAINNGATIPNLSKEKIATLKIPIPPLHEQTAIVKFLSETTKRIESNIKLCSRQIDLMQEYRARLISNVVTGKLDVREVALKLLLDNDDSHTLNQEQ